MSIISLIRRIPKLACRCRGRMPDEGRVENYSLLRYDMTGACLGWSCRVEVSICSQYSCDSCGTIYTKSDSYLPNVASRDASDWPLTKTGERMPMDGEGYSECVVIRTGPNNDFTCPRPGEPMPEVYNPGLMARQARRTAA